MRHGPTVPAHHLIGRVRCILLLGHLGNTIDAFAASRAAGADGVELDVRRGRDGALVVHHDAVVESAGKIVELTAAELPGDVPLLPDALNACAGMVVNVEIKNLPVDGDYDPTEEIAALVVEALAEHPNTRVIVSSFSLATLDEVRRLDSSVATAFLTLPAWDQTRAVIAARDHGHHALHPHRRSLDAALVDLVHEHGMTIHPWGLDDPTTALAAAELGVDAIITDDPVAVVAALRGKSTSG